MCIYIHDTVLYILLRSFWHFTARCFISRLSPRCHSYTKPKGQLPDYLAPVVLQVSRATVEDLCNSIHKSIMKEFKQ